MQADEVQNAKEPIAAQIDLSGQILSTSHDPGLSPLLHFKFARTVTTES